MFRFVKKNTHPVLGFWLISGWVGYFFLPWYSLEDGFFSFGWISSDYFSDSETSSGFLSSFVLGDKFWLAPILFFLVLPLFALSQKKTSKWFSFVLIFSGTAGIFWIVFQGITIGLQAANFDFLKSFLSGGEVRQFGIGYGGSVVFMSFLAMLCMGIAARGVIGGDVFVVSSIGFIIAFITIFVVFPVFKLFSATFINEEGVYSILVFFQKFNSGRIWSLNCLIDSKLKCGVAWNSFFMAIVVASLSTILGLVFALVITRTNLKIKKLLRVLAVLPLITPPFVIGLAIIMMFGLSGVVTTTLSDWFNIEPTRWLYGLPGILIAQVLAYTPITFLVLIGVLENIGPDLEEASLMLRASKWNTFTTITLPLLQPGLANAFLLGFIQSLADFGNPFVLGGNYEVLSTEIFYAVVGAQYDQGKAAVLSIILLFFTLLAFYLQNFWLKKKSFITITGKSSASRHPELPKSFSNILITIAFFWFVITIIIYGMIIFGSFTETWGLKNSFTIKHYITAFGVSWEENGWIWKGSAWDSFFTTVMVASISAPITAFIGIITSWLLNRKNFLGKNWFEFVTMLCFAIPGTVIGVSYIFAYNLPPIEITGTGIILIISFVCRNLPVGVRAGIASLNQIDKSLDESSLTLGANSFQTFIRVSLPLIRPAILTALIFSFVRSMTAISAVIFLVSAEYDLSTSYILGRVENNDYGLAIAYSTALIFTMLLVIILMQKLVGKAKIKRDDF